jgi:hypothetical protein
LPAIENEVAKIVKNVGRVTPQKTAIANIARIGTKQDLFQRKRRRSGAGGAF